MEYCFQISAWNIITLSFIVASFQLGMLIGLKARKKNGGGA